ncbi:uncharacterized protein LOC132795966 isoform X2 [Drosophila nasuta]|uniref:uncharacterized protein LOC132795966 isoform X2 n=1 Tax=Drosophila nasuta TaxID=42062 RepID=UPI00295EA062|nr:uncharacterized protein LOC132795966 isoform X2 [Drosophila nasuta]
MYNESQQTRANDAAQIRSQQCEPTDENWRRNITFANNENEFRGPLAHNLATMPLEQLSDMTPPNWETTATTTTTADASTTQPNSYVDSLYQEIVNRFDELRRCIARGDNQQQHLPHDACDVCTTQQNGTQRTMRKVTTLRDQCGNVTGRLEETSTVSNGRTEPPGEQLADISMPTFHEDNSTIPTLQQQQHLSGECIANTNAPGAMLLDSTMTGRVNQTVGNILAPSFGTNVCLEDVGQGMQTMRQQQQQQPVNSLPNECLDNVTAHSSCECLEDVTAPSSLGHSRLASRRHQQRSQNICDVTAPSFASSTHGATRLEDLSMPSFGGISGAARARSPSRQQRENICDITAPSFGNESIGDATMTTECLQDISMPTFGQVSGASRAKSPRRQQRSGRFAVVTNECLNNVTMPSFGGVSGPSRRQQTMPSECLENITQPSFGRSRSVDNFLDMPSSYGNSRGAALINECLDNVTMPSFGGVSGSSRRHQTMPSECLENMTQPSFGVSRRLAITNECLDNITMPSLNEASGSLNRQQTMPSECLENITQPSFGSSRAVVDFLDMPSSGNSRAAAMTNECLDNVTMPSFGGVSGSSRRQRTMPSECLENITQPSFESSRGVDHFLDVPSSYGNSRGAALTNECLDKVTMPSFGGVSGSLRRQRTMPSECLENITQPSFGSSPAAALTNDCLDNITMPSFIEVSSSLRRQQTMPSECLADVTQPSYGNSRSLAITSECLDNMTMPTFGGVSGSSRRQQTLPLECLDNVTQPTFADSRRQQKMYDQSAYYDNSSNSRTGGRRQRSQNICDVTAPSFGSSSRGLDDFGGVSSASRTRSLRRRQRSAAPAFQSTGRGQLTNECLDNVTMPSFGGVSAASRRQQSLPSAWLNDVTQPSFGSSSSRGQTTRRQQQNMSNMRSMRTQECLDDMTMPSFGGISGISSRRMPSECLADVSAPSSFGGRSRSARRSPYRGESFGNSTINPCLEDVSMPSFGGVSGASRARSPRRQQRSGRSAVMTNECLDNVTMPSFGGVSGSSRRQQTMPSECLEDITQPSFGRSRSVDNFLDMPSSYGNSRRAALINECLDNVTMPSFGGVSGSSRRHQTMPSECLEDITQPSFGESRRLALTNECLDNITMPSLAVSLRRQQIMPSECLENVTQPSFGSSRAAVGFADMPSAYGDSRAAAMPSECLDNVTMPSFGDSLRRQQTMPSECLENITQPSFGSSRAAALTNECLDNVTMPSFGGVSGSLRRHRTMPSECLENITQPSFGNSRAAALTNECLDNITMPSFNEVASSLRRQRTMPSECLENITQPSFIEGRSRVMSNECLDNMTAPSFGGVSGVSRRQQLLPSECLENVTQPSFEDMSYYVNDNASVAHGRRQTSRRQQRSQNICDVTAPSFASSTRGATRLEDLSMPSFGGISGASRARSLSRRQRENICDITAPSFAPENATMPSYAGRSQSQGATRRNIRDLSSEYLEDMTMPSYAMSQNTPQLWDITPPEWDYNSYASYTRRPRSVDDGNVMRSLQVSGLECLDDVTMPTMRRTRSFPCVPSQQRLGNDNESTMNVLHFSYQSRQPIDADASYPSELLGNVSAPTYASNLSRPQRSDRSNMQSEKPTMLDSTANQRPRNNFARSTAIGEEIATADSNEAPCQCPASQVDQTSSQIRQNASEKQASNQSIAKQEDGSAAKKEVTIIASVTSMTRIYMKKNDDSNYQNINDISMPSEYQSGANKTMFITNISEPSFTNLSATNPNYNATAQTSTTLGTPQPVRDNPNNARKCVANNRVEARAKCCCSNNCRRYRKSRQSTMKTRHNPDFK